MGNTSSTSASTVGTTTTGQMTCPTRPITLEELAQGATTQMNGFVEIGCGVAGNPYDSIKSQGFDYPNNSEFTFSSGSACTMNPGKYGCEQSGGVIGSRGKITRTAFNGDPTQCCIQQPATFVLGNATCNPIYANNYKTPDCDDYMLSYCSNGKWTSDPSCEKWMNAAVSAGKTVANSALSTYCAQGTNFTQPICQNWCSSVRQIPSMATACDYALTQYCQNNGGDPNCQCLKPPVNITNVQNLIAAPKVCWYTPCKSLKNTNYVTKNMQDEQCVAVACEINAGDITSSGTQNKVVIENKCGAQALTNAAGGTGGNAPPPDSPPSAPSSGSGSNTSSSSPSSNTPLLIGGSVSISLCICCCLILIIIGVIMMNRNNEE